MPRPSDAQWTQWQEDLHDRSAEEIIQWAARTFPDKITFATSVGLEDQVLTDMLARLAPHVPVFTLDTGRLFAESYTLLAETEARYGLSIRVYFPDATEVEEMVAEHGVNLFRNSVELRKRCCAVRKLHPLRRALAGRDAWMVGLRREQSVTRGALSPLEWDEGNGLLKISPLWNWSDVDVWDYVRAHHVPFNPLHDQGYASIGCAPCTRAVLPGEDPRAGRWWWERPEQRECGLHLVTPLDKGGKGGS